MKRQFKKALVAAAMVGAMAAGISGTASAYVYGTSHVQVTGFTFGSVPLASNPVPSDFRFTLQNSAAMSGPGGGAAFVPALCGGTPTANNCGKSPAFTLDPLAAEVPVGARGSQNNFGFVGTGTQYASSDSVITTAQLVDGVPSAENQIAEANLLSNPDALAGVELQSTTNLLLSFTSGPGGGFTLNFSADVDLRDAISELLSGIYSSQSNATAVFTLTNTDNSGTISWKPNGVLNASDCVVTGLAGTTCSETADGGGNPESSLNVNRSTGVNNTDIRYSDNNTFNPYGITVTGLAACAVLPNGAPNACYSLSFNVVTSTNISREVGAVPEPASLALVGLGLAAMGFRARRRDRKA